MAAANALAKGFTAEEIREVYDFARRYDEAARSGAGKAVLDDLYKLSKGLLRGAAKESGQDSAVAVLQPPRPKKKKPQPRRQP